ncbi:natural resistance-associated macrophage protein [Mollisia scopiformis]|uniref:Natural resistance-associated macrophage protein n=1 Tax=Mollisia scopiformis TaxID=149040 RepID=A0A194XB53_MOLSC|nr:natural resistance-associated macrophage protein [Mollisia scopiformis]KUJ17398.1 natural resistance-associated macrophage protein [Mollisia scopiformis]
MEAVKSVLLAKAPVADAPLEFGGHRIAEEPTKKLGVGGVLSKFARFFGPGMILAVAYVDPDNFQTSVEDGQDFGYKMLFMVLFSLVVAIYLQYLCLRMATVTGLNLAQMNHKYMPRWLELSIYAVAEACCICTDISAVIGTAFAWNLLIPKLPLDAACVITVFDTLLILLFYSPTGTLRHIRYFEMFMAALVAVIFITTAIALGQVHPAPGPVFKGFLPSREIFVSQGMYSSAGMVGGMLMPHALYVGSSIAQPRLLEYDTKYHITTFRQNETPIDVFYRPSLRAIKSTLRYATWDLCLAIFVVGLFVNSAPEILSGAAFSQDGNFTDLYDLYSLFQTGINQLSATMFAVAFLFSGIAAGIVSTMAGQTVMEGAFQIKINPFARRLITRCIAIIPALIVTVSVGQEGISNALTAVNYILSIGLIFVLLPVIWYVTHDKYMSVLNDEGTELVSLKLGLTGTIFAWAVWAIVIVTDVATIVLLGLGLSD